MCFLTDEEINTFGNFVLLILLFLGICQSFIGGGAGSLGALAPTMAVPIDCGAVAEEEDGTAPCVSKLRRNAFLHKIVKHVWVIGHFSDFVNT